MSSCAGESSTIHDTVTVSSTKVREAVDFKDVISNDANDITDLK